MSRGTRFGLSAALTTPFGRDGRINLGKMVAHAQRCLTNGCDSVTLFGTTGEGASLSHDERTAVFKAVTDAGVTPDRIVIAVSETAAASAIELGRIALSAGCRNVMFPPPFYFKDPSAEGLFAWYATVIEGLGALARGVILYHIPSCTSVSLPLDLIVRLAKAFPEAIAGVKDSGGNWAFTEALLQARGSMEVMVGDERHLARAVRAGGAGAISGLANVFPKRIRALAVDGQDDASVSELVDRLVQMPVTPAVKALLAHVLGDPEWARTRAPLDRTPDGAAAALAAFYDKAFLVGQD